jgi:hypothetical protein
MENKMKKYVLLIAASSTALLVAACQRDAQVASYNLSRAAEMFEINRRTVFYNGINGEYILTIEGLCSIEHQAHQLEVTCKTGPQEYKKHFLGLSDNVTYFSEQVSGADVSAYHYRVTFKPQAIIPDIEARGDASALRDAAPEINPR